MQRRQDTLYRFLYRFRIESGMTIRDRECVVSLAMTPARYTSKYLRIAMALEKIPRISPVPSIIAKNSKIFPL